MKAKIATLLITLLATCSFAQITFEKGYFINNNNQRIDCLIKNYDWKNNPKEIEYKTDATSEKHTAEISSIKEFGISGYSKFVRVKTNVDRSSLDMSVSTQSSPEWSNEEIFLKVLLEGRASLYYYEDGSLQRFFYSLSDTLIKQLIYKEYLTADKTIAINSGFRQQLWIDVRCPKTTMSSVGNLIYNRNALLKYFKTYNDCNGNLFVEYNKKGKGELFSLRLVPGINYTTITIANNTSNIKNTDFENVLGFRIGLEAEAILPFNKNKWGLLFEPTYQYSNSTGKNSLGHATIQYNSIEFAVGVRYNLFLNKNLSLYFNGFYIPSYSTDFHSTIDFDYPFASPLNIKSMGSQAFGGGIKHKKISAEFRYYTNREILGSYLNWYSDYQRFSFLIGYRLNGKH